MAARQVMRHRCTTQRAQPAAADTWGNQPDTDWAPHLTEQPCRVFFRAGQRTIQPGSDAVLEDLRLLLPLGTDVTSEDQVAEVTDRRGVVLLAGPLLIDAIALMDDHLLLLLKQVS